MRTAAVLLILAGILPAQEKTAVKVCRMSYVLTEEGKTTAKHTYGTGVVIASGKDYSFILTNAHVAPDDAIYHIESKQTLMSCEWVCAIPSDDRASKGDLALLKCDWPLPVAKLASKEPAKDVLVEQFGFPRAGRLSKLSGKWLGDDGGWSRMTDYLSVPGCSGSGVYYKDELIGLCFAVSNLKDKYGNRVTTADGGPILAAPTMIVSLDCIEKFLLSNIPKELGYVVQTGPMPRHIPRGGDRIR